MNPIAIFYHVRLSGSAKNIDPVTAIKIVSEQMDELHITGLMDAASEFHVGFHGEEKDSIPMRIMAGNKASIICHGEDTTPLLVGELPTFGMLQDWLPSHPNWHVLYFHSKGVTQPYDPLRTAWRYCMMNAVVRKWEICYDALTNGMDMAGAHWLTNKQYPFKVGPPTPIWGGNFWWAKSNYLAKLPPIPRQPTPECNGMIAENWVGFGENPSVLDLAPHWPNFHDCSKLS